MDKKDTIFLLHDNVLLKPISEETTTEGDFLKANHSPSQVKKAIVVSIGKTSLFTVGNKVLYSAPDAQKVEIDGVNYLITKLEGILAVL